MRYFPHLHYNTIHIVWGFGICLGQTIDVYLVVMSKWITRHCLKICNVNFDTIRVLPTVYILKLILVLVFTSSSTSFKDLSTRCLFNVDIVNWSHLFVFQLLYFLSIFSYSEDTPLTQFTKIP